MDKIATKWGNIPVNLDPKLGPSEFYFAPPIKPVVKVYRGQLPTDAQIKEAIRVAMDKAFGR